MRIFTRKENDSMNRAIHYLTELIAIPSVNPDGDPGTDSSGEKACAEQVAVWLRKLGASVRLEEVLPDRPNVIGVFPSDRPDKPKLVLGPHLDTVSVGGMTIPPFDPQIRDGRIHGRGASDTKGTAAAMLAALEELGTGGIAKLGAQITFAGFMGEESGQWGSKHFANHHPHHDFALIGEPTGCAVVHTHKGSFWAELAARGKAVHGSTPHLGENAILKMMEVTRDVLQRFGELVDGPELDHPVLGKSTLNVGMIRGGVRANIVPDECRLLLDMRLTPALYQRDPEAFLRNVLDESPHAASLELISRGVCAPLDTDPNHPFVKKLAAAGSGLAGAPWFCDAAWLAAAGIPSVAAGPGSIAQAHTADEFLSIDDLNAGVAFYRRFLESL